MLLYIYNLRTCLRLPLASIYLLNINSNFLKQWLYLSINDYLSKISSLTHPKKKKKQRIICNTIYLRICTFPNKVAFKKATRINRDASTRTSTPNDRNRAWIITKHPCTNNKSLANNVTCRQKDHYGRDCDVVACFDRERWRRQLLYDSSRTAVENRGIEVACDEHLGFALELSDVAASTSWRIQRGRDESICGACCLAILIIPFIVRYGTDRSHDESFAQLKDCFARENRWNIIQRVQTRYCNTTVFVIPFID